MKELCSICLVEEFKYTCPACQAKTCSVVCVKRHKLRSECSGAVDPSKYVPHKELASDSALVNRDYNYLLNFERSIELGKADIKNSAKNVFKRSYTQPNKKPRYNAPNDPRVASVNAKFASPATSVKRENTLVIQLPPGMSRATQNKSGYDKKSGCFTWTVEWAPVDSEGITKDSFISYRLKETSTLKDAVPMAVLHNSIGKEIETDQLHFYLDNCISTKTGRSLIALDASETLSKALANMVVLEYPKIYITVGLPWEQYVQPVSEAYGLNSSESESESLSDSDSSSEESSSDLEPEELSSKIPEKKTFEDKTPEATAPEEKTPEAMAPEAKSPEDDEYEPTDTIMVVETSAPTS